MGVLECDLITYISRNVLVKVARVTCTIKKLLLFNGVEHIVRNKILCKCNPFESLVPPL